MFFRIRLLTGRQCTFLLSFWPIKIIDYLDIFRYLGKVHFLTDCYLSVCVNGTNLGSQSLPVGSHIRLHGVTPTRKLELYAVSSMCKDRHNMLIGVRDSHTMAKAKGARRHALLKSVVLEQLIAPDQLPLLIG